MDRLQRQLVRLHLPAPLPRYGPLACLPNKPRLPLHQLWLAGQDNANARLLVSGLAHAAAITRHRLADAVRAARLTHPTHEQLHRLAAETPAVAAALERHAWIVPQLDQLLARNRLEEAAALVQALEEEAAALAREDEAREPDRPPMPVP
jgi:hypothetical protein